jgi:hypothetical protein
VGVGHLDTERNRFAAEITFCHFSAPPFGVSSTEKVRQIKSNRSILADFPAESKFFFATYEIFLKIGRYQRFFLVIFVFLRYTTLWKFIETWEIAICFSN